MVDLNVSLLVAVLQAELDILAHGLAFLLGQRSHNGKKHFPLGVHRIDGFLFKVNRDVLIFKLADKFQAVQRVSGKATNGFCDNHIDVASHTLINHTIEFGTLFGVGTGDTVISKNACQLPFWILGNILCIMFNLCVIAGGLLIAVGTDTAVRCDSELRLFRGFDGVADLTPCRYDHNLTLCHW